MTALAMGLSLLALFWLSATAEACAYGLQPGEGAVFLCAGVLPSVALVLAAGWCVWRVVG